MFALLVTTDCDCFLVELMLSQFNCFAAIFRTLPFVFVFSFVIVVFFMVMVCEQIAIKFHLATYYVATIYTLIDL